MFERAKVAEEPFEKTWAINKPISSDLTGYWSICSYFVLYRIYAFDRSFFFLVCPTFDDDQNRGITPPTVNKAPPMILSQVRAECSEAKPCPMHVDDKVIKQQLIRLFSKKTIQMLAREIGKGTKYINNSKLVKLSHGKS